MVFPNKMKQQNDKLQPDGNRCGKPHSKHAAVPYKRICNIPYNINRAKNHCGYAYQLLSVIHNEKGAQHLHDYYRGYPNEITLYIFQAVGI